MFLQGRRFLYVSWYFCTATFACRHACCFLIFIQGAFCVCKLYLNREKPRSLFWNWMTKVQLNLLFALPSTIAFYHSTWWCLTFLNCQLYADAVSSLHCQLFMENDKKFNTIVERFVSMFPTRFDKTFF